MVIKRYYSRLVSWFASLYPDLEVNRINNGFPVSIGKWCDYCECDSCQLGLEVDLCGPRYECIDGTHICYVCYTVEPCYDGITRRGSVFCDAHPNCSHKPKLVIDNTHNPAIIQT